MNALYLRLQQIDQHYNSGLLLVKLLKQLLDVILIPKRPELQLPRRTSAFKYTLGDGLHDLIESCGKNHRAGQSSLKGLNQVWLVL